MATTNAGAGGTAGGEGGSDAQGGSAAGGASSGAGAKKAAGGGGKTGAAGAAGKATAAKPGGARKGSGSSVAGGKAGVSKSGGSRVAGAGGRSGAGKSAAKAGTTKGSGTARGTRKTASSAKAGDGEKPIDTKLRADLREFVQAHPGGWGHNEWIGLVNLLRDRGHDTSDTDAIGMALERERLTLVLERVPGLGPGRVSAIADKYPRLWNLMQAGVDELATVAKLPKTVARKVKDALP